MTTDVVADLRAALGFEADRATEFMIGMVWLTPGRLFRYDGMIWSAGTARKPGICWWSGRRFERGDTVFRPLTNNCKRMRRICEEVVHE